MGQGAESAPPATSLPVRLLDWIRGDLRFPGSAWLMVIAILIGASAAGFAVVFRLLIEVFTHFFTGQDDYAANPGAAHPHLEALGPYFIVGVPVLVGLLYGPLVHYFAREARGHGVPEVMYAVSRRGGDIKPKVAVVKALASALCIGGGGSVGREGPVVQIGSAIGSTIGKWTGAPTARIRIFVACGAAAGIAATFNAPLAGVFFALELILMDFTATSFGVVVISSVVAGALGRAVFGDVPFLELPAFTVEHPAEYLLFALLGVLAGAVGVGFFKILYRIEDACDAIWRGPEWLRPAVGGLLLGLVLLALPQMYGVGYPVLGEAVTGTYAIGFLLLLLVGKIVATSLTLGIGGSGGVFAPSLFIGAMLGAAFGLAAQQVVPGVAGPVGAYGLIGMGAVFAGSSRASITAVIIMFELTSEYSIILPLMTAIVLATAVSHRLSPDSIYTLKLSRRGVDLRPGADEVRPPISTVMRAVPVPIGASATLHEAAARLSRAEYGVLPVTDADGKVRGIVTARSVAQALADGLEDTEHAELITELPVRVLETDGVDRAVEALNETGCGALPVYPEARGVFEPVGWVTYRDALRVV